MCNAPSRLILTATITALAVVVALPLLFIVLQAVFPAIGANSLADPFGRFLAVFSDPLLFRLTGNTIALGLCVVAGCAVLAVPLAAIRALFRLPFAPLWDLLFLIPFMIPPYIAALGWIMTLQPRGFAQQLLGLHAGPFLFSFGGVVFVMVLNIFPVVYFAVSRTLEAVGGRYGEVARVFGATPWRAFRRITLPLATPGLAASLLIVFALAVEEYGTPAALGARSGFYVLVTGIEQKVSDWPIDLSAASWMSLILMGLSLTAFWVQLKILVRRNYETVGGKPQSAPKRELGPWKYPALALFAFAALLGTGTPLFAIFAAALSRTLSGGLVWSNLGFGNFLGILDNQADALTALGTSLSLGIGTAVVTGLVGTMAAYFVVRTRLPGRQLLDALTILPNAIPGIVVAVGVILAWNNPLWPVSPYNTPWILVLAYSCILLPYPVRYANAAFRQLGENVELAARVCGATLGTTLRRILFPLIAPSMIAAMLLVFAVASRELVATILVAPVGTSTVATFIWKEFEQGSVGLGMAMSATAILITTTIPVLVTLIMRRMGKDPA